MASREFKPLDAMSDPAMAPFLAHGVGQPMFEASVVDGTLARVVGEPEQFPNSPGGDVAWRTATQQIRDKQATERAIAAAAQFDAERGLRWVEVHGDAAGMLPVLTDTERLGAVTLEAAEDAERLTPNVLRELLSERRSAPPAPRLVFAAHKPDGSAASSRPVTPSVSPRASVRETILQGVRAGHELSRGRRGVVFALGQKAVEAFRASWASAGVYGGIIRQNTDEHGMRRGLSAGMRAAAYHFMEWDRPGGGRPTRQEVANNVAASLQDLGEVAVRAFQRAHGYLENRADDSILATATLWAGRTALRASGVVGFVASNVRQGAQRKQQADAAAAPTSENLPEA